MPESTRLFVGNLPFGISENDLSSEFGFYGKVNNVELKQKKDANGDDASLFAFVTLESDIQSINKCIHEFSEQKWKGSFLNISIARESFMEKLKREREEEERRKHNQLQPPTVAQGVPEVSITAPYKPSLKVITKPATVNGHLTNGSADVKRPKSKFENEKNDIEEHEENFEIETPVPEYSVKSNKSFEIASTIQDQSFVKKKKNKFEASVPIKKTKLRIESVIKVTPSEEKKPQLVKTLTAADEKRLKSIQNMRTAYNEKKSLIKIALSSVDKKVNKITFNDDGTAITNKETAVASDNSSVKKNKRGHNDESFTKKQEASSAKKTKKSLFDETESADEDDNINFDIKEQFQGEAGQKLLQLQARFQSDDRFAMDERFIDDGREDDDEEKGQVDDNVEDDERLRQIEILQGILGTTVKTSSRFPTAKNSEPNKKLLPVKTMLRYDPSRPDHDKFMKPVEKSDGQPKKSKKERKRERELAVMESEKAEEKPVPEVSQERYYKVNESLKQSMEEQKPFSLLSLFGNREPEDNAPKKDYHAEDIKKSNDKFKNPLQESNPFKYDSDSDDEETTKKTNEQQNESPYGVAQSKPLLVMENFFFCETDPRFKDGLDFFLNSEPRSEKSREELKFLVKRRIQNNMRNERSHFKKVQQRHPAKTTKFRRK